MTSAAPIKHTCPRRMSDWGPWERTEGLDEYTAGHGLGGQPAGCSFCGSLPPDDFMEMVRGGAVVGPTDKSYKLYISKALTDDEKSARRQRWLDTDGIARAIRELGERDGKTPEEIGADLDQEWTRTHLPYLTGGTEAKFYTAHLSPEQGREFYELWQAGKVNWGYPGHPYRPLYLPGFEKTGDAA